MYKHIIKRLIDISLATVLIFLLCPIVLVVWFLLSIIHKGNCVFFIQTRVGYEGQLFSIIKFKTMTESCDENGKLLPDSLRITRFGSLIRSISFDEVPQLVNVLKGDMSLIGPRPLLIQYLPLYSKEQARRHEVKPGITGWAQVNGRNAISWKQKFEYDVWYVDNMSFALDFKILLMTIKKVFKREGITQEGHATAEAFTGNN